MRCRGKRFPMLHFRRSSFIQLTASGPARLCRSGSFLAPRDLKTKENRMKRITTVGLVTMCVCLAAAVFAMDSQKAAIGQAAPAFSLQDQDGKTISLADNAGKVVVLEWFNEDCPIDMRVYKQDDSMKKLAQKWMDKGVVWLAVNSTKNKTNETNKK